MTLKNMRPASLAFTYWRDCTKRQQELRKKLALPRDEEANKIMCEGLYQTYLKIVLRARER